MEAPTPQPQPTNNITTHGFTQGSLQPQECAPRCTMRCSKTAYKKPCMFFCQKCCAKCLCVPPGTYGNKQVCPCYNNWKTKRGGPKCPAPTAETTQLGEHQVEDLKFGRSSAYQDALP
ncbi:Gibberellin regulated protein [Dillenia turbinata]|uniref:Gibberellin regulated protein n=1 Tax=Dillenia turbinata TaxID=194707 RepID=A0AAN8W4I6_9MAGN